MASLVGISVEGVSKNFGDTSALEDLTVLDTHNQIAHVAITRHDGKGRAPDSMAYYEHARAAGQVASVDLVKDRETGNSKGFAFVEMNTRAEAQKAISLLNGFNLEERELKVHPAKPREARSSGLTPQQSRSYRR